MRRGLSVASFIIICQAMLNAMLICLAIWGFKDSFAEPAGNNITAFTDRAGNKILATSAAMHNLPMYVAPILPDVELGHVRAFSR